MDSAIDSALDTARRRSTCGSGTGLLRRLNGNGPVWRPSGLPSVMAHIRARPWPERPVSEAKQSGNTLLRWRSAVVGRQAARERSEAEREHPRSVKGSHRFPDGPSSGVSR